MNSLDMETLTLIKNWLTNLVSRPTETGNFSEEEIEAFRKSTGFKAKEILRLFQVFEERTSHQPLLDKDMFLSIPGIRNNPCEKELAIVSDLKRKVL